MAHSERGPRVDLDVLALAAHRLRKGWTQFDLAVAARVQPGTISRLETGAHSPNLVTVERLAAALGIPKSALIGTNPMYRPPRGCKGWTKGAVR